MKSIAVLLCGILVASSATAATHTYNWQSGYGHWNAYAADNNNGMINEDDEIVFQSNSSQSASWHWKNYYTIIDGALTHTGRGFSVNGGSNWFNNAGTGEKSTNTTYTDYSTNIVSTMPHPGYSQAHHEDRPWVTEEVKSAWADGWTGKGVNIQIIDGFQNWQQMGIAHTFNTAWYGNPLTRRYSKTWVHGDVTAMVAGGTTDYGTHQFTTTGTVGVAPEANVSKKAYLGQFAYYNDYISTGYDFNWTDKDIVNMSFSNSASYYTVDNINDFWVRSLAATTENPNGTLITKSAGNINQYTVDQDTISNSLMSSDYADSTIIVGALDSSGTIAGYSTKAGTVHADNYIVDYADTNLITTSNIHVVGTSFAAPRVAGKAALIMQKFDELSAENVANLIFETAIDLGETGTDSTYGRGQMNLSGAMSPVGLLQ